MVRINQLIQQIVQEYHIEKEKLPGLTKTKLLKLCYLVEFYYFKKNQKRLTEEEWIYYLYGPYLFNFDKHLQNCPFSIIEVENKHNEYEIIEMEEGYFKKEGIDEFDIKMLIRRIIKEFGEKNLEEIIDFIYFETEPMQKVKRRKEKLDFTAIKEKEKIIKQNLSKNETKKILNKYKEMKKVVRAI